ncbi:MAG TPA: TetR/AcrR family transcriptional regulator [Cellulomonas sp.]
MTSVREQIVKAALALVADRGIAATSIDDIAAAAGVAKGSIFYNFGSKSGLFAAIIGDGVAHLTAALKEAAEQHNGRDALDALVTELLGQIRDHPDFAKLVTTEIFRRGRDWQESIGTIRRDAIGTFVDATRQAWPGCDAELTAAALFGATLMAGLDWLVFQPERSLDDVRNAVLTATGRVAAY